MSQVKIKKSFQEELKNLCGLEQDYITVYRTEDKKVFFSYGPCKLHVTKDELEQVREG